MKLENCRYCESDEIRFWMHGGLWSGGCRGDYCLFLQCCDTKEQAIERWNEINVTNLKQGAK